MTLYFSNNRIPVVRIVSYEIVNENEEYFVKYNNDKYNFSNDLLLMNYIFANRKNLEFVELINGNEVIASYTSEEYLSKINELLSQPYVPNELREDFAEYFLSVDQEMKLVFESIENKFETTLYPIIENKDFFISEFCT